MLYSQRLTLHRNTLADAGNCIIHGEAILPEPLAPNGKTLLLWINYETLLHS